MARRRRMTIPAQAKIRNCSVHRTPVSPLPQLLHCPTNSLFNFDPRFVFVFPGFDWLPIFWERLQFAEWCTAPTNRANNNRNDTRTARFMACNRSCHLLVVTEIRSKEVGTDQQQNNIRCFEVFVDLYSPLLASGNLSVLPRVNNLLPLE